VFRGLQDTLQRDGFSVHVLEQGGGAGLALRGRTSIAFRRDNNDIVFNCEAGEVPVVKTAVLYVVRELRTTLEAMRRPLDVQRMLREVPGGGAPADGGRDLRPFLRPDLVKLRLKGDRPEAILRELVELASAAGLVEDMDEVLGAVLAREQSMSTGLERGIAVPHCRTDSVPRLVCAIGLKPEGVDFGALDGQPSRIFVLTLSPASDPAPHVVFMSQIVQALTPAVCRRLLRAESTHEAIAILSSRPEPGGLEPPVAAESPARHAAPHTVRPNAIKEAVMVPRLRAADREGVVDELLAVLAARQPIMGDLSQVRRQVLQREQALSTGLERGIAVPHCRTAAVDRVLCAVGLRPEGLDFGSRDGAPTQIVVLILASTSMPTPYAQTLALLLHALERIPRAELFAYTDAEALHARIWATVEEASGVA
jgi:PTS system nitrogen regulatory IIA component